MKGFTVFPVVVRTHWSTALSFSTHGPKEPNSFEGTESRGGAGQPHAHWAVAALSGLVRTCSSGGYRLNKGSVQGYWKIRINELFLFGRCNTRDVHFGLGGPDLISA